MILPPPAPLGIVGTRLPALPAGGAGYQFPAGGFPPEKPAIEQLREYAGRFEPEQLLPGARHFNGSIVRWDSRLWMAYRLERWDGINRLVMAELDSDWSVVSNQVFDLPESGPEDHWEDPRLVVIAGALYLSCAHVRFGVPPLCRQCLFALSPKTLQPEREIPLPFGRNNVSGAIEKNWMPFELPGGRVGLVYSQRPHLVIDQETTRGHTTAGLTGWALGKVISGRTPPVRIGEGYLAFFGGHVKHAYRAARYFVGAHVFEARPPFRIILATPGPLAWGSEASPTLYSSRPNSGYPMCLFPAGVVVEDGQIWVSAGVNDSYTALLRYELGDLLAVMREVNSEGGFA